MLIISQSTKWLGFVKPLAVFINHFRAGMRMAQRVDGSYKGSKLNLEGRRCVGNNCSPFQAVLCFTIKENYVKVSNSEIEVDIEYFLQYAYSIL